MKLISKFVRHLVVVPTTLLLLLIGCGGGGNTPNNDDGESQIQSFDISVDISGNGNVSPQSASVKSGQYVSLSISPDEGFRIGSVEGCNGNLVESIYTTQPIAESCVVSVNFLPEEFYQVTLVAGSNGSFDTSSNQIWVRGLLELSLLPDSGYVVNEVTGCHGALEGSTYTTAILTEDCTVTASFKLGTVLDFEVAPIKKLQFTWGETPEATHYNLFENPDRISGFSQIGVEIPTGIGAVEHNVPLHLRANAQYLLQICNDTECDVSNIVNMNNTALINGIGYIKASNPDSIDQFGQKIKLSDDGSTLAVATTLEKSNAIGINGDQSDNSAEQAGVVYIFSNADGQWIQQAYVKASNTEAWDQFGHSIDLSADGSILVVGATGEDSNDTGINGDESDNTGGRVGAVYVFVRDGSEWAQQAYIKPAEAPPTGHRLEFGIDVSLDAGGATMAVGSLFGNANSNGQVHLFNRTENTWELQQIISPAKADSLDQFGKNVELSSDGYTLAVGAPYEDSNAVEVNGNEQDNSLRNSGAAYIYTRSGGGIWSQQAFIKASNPGEEKYFGQALSLSGDGGFLAVGVYRESSSSAQSSFSETLSWSGAVYVYRFLENSWTFFNMLKASNLDESDYFGDALSFSGDGSLLVVGADGEDGAGKGLGGDKTSNYEQDRRCVPL